MAYATVNVRMDADVKKGFEEFCEDVGMNISTAFNVFVKAVLSQRRIPFEIAQREEDPFYKGANGRHLQKSLDEWNDPNVPKIVKTMEELEAMAVNE